MNADGISYLDLGDAWARGDWSNAINAYWSPMYSWLLEIASRFAPPVSEAPMARVANIALLALAVIGFELFWRELASGEDEQPRPALRDLTAGLLALWSLLALLGVVLLTPDLLVVAFVLIAFALLQRVGRGASARAYAALGCVLAAGYLAKSVMFPVALMTLACVFVDAIRRKMGLRKPLIAIGIFAALSAPLVIALSAQKGRVTFGDSGRVNFAFYVNGVPGVAHWRGGPPGAGMPVHPTRQISLDPYAYEFRKPIAGTYPPWYDPSYWYEGIEPHPDLAKQLWLLKQHAVILAPLLWPAIAALLLVLAAGGSARLTLAALAERWAPALVSIGAILMYSVVYVEERYVAAFVLVLMLWVVSSMRVIPSRAAVVPFACVLIAAPAVRVLYDRAEKDLFDATMLIRGVWRDENTGYRIAQALRREGVPAGASIFLIGTGTHAYWARLASVRVIAEVPHAEVARFWYLGNTRRGEFLARMARATGAAYVVADQPPEVFGTRDWIPLGVSGLLLRRLEPGNEVQPAVEQRARRPWIEPESVAKVRRP